MNWLSWAAVFIGGGLGSLARYAVGRLIVDFGYQQRFPLGILLANVLACLVFALVMLMSVRYGIKNNLWMLFSLVGFCGGFSTFSTFSYDNFALYQSGNYLLLFANILLNVLLCFGIFMLFGRQVSELA